MFPLVQLRESLMGCLPRLMKGRMCSLCVWGGYKMNIVFPKGASLWALCILFTLGTLIYTYSNSVQNRDKRISTSHFLLRPWAYWAHTTRQLQGAREFCLFQLACNGCAFLGHWFQHSSVHGQQCMKGIYVQDGGITGWTLAWSARVANSKWNLGVYRKLPS